MKDDYVGALLEDIDHKFDVILESLSFMATKTQLQAVADRLERVESDVKIIKRVVTEHSKELKQLKTQIA